MASGGDVRVSYKTHYARLGHATQNLIPKILQKLLLHFENPKDISKKCKSNKYLVRKLPVKEWDKINDASTNGYANFDIPLVYAILRNINLTISAPTQGWDYAKDPTPTETNIGDDIERCRRTRNSIIHRGNTTVTDQELDTFFDLFIGIAERFEKVLNKTPGEFVSEFVDLKTCFMGEEEEKMYLDKIHTLLKKAKEMEEKHLESMRQWEKKSLENEERINELESYFDQKFVETQDRDNRIIQLESMLQQQEKETEERILLLEETIKSLKSSDTENIEFINPLTDKTCFEGDTVSLECTVAGGKKHGQWYKNDETVLSENLRDESKDQVYKLTIYKATREDAGVYKFKILDKIFEARLNVIEKGPSHIQLRNYQLELAEIALNGENTIVCAGTNAGKTYVAFHVIENHLLKNPRGRVVFINKTNVLLEQQYRRACEIFTTLHFQEQIYKWQAGEDDDTKFTNIVQKTRLLFLTPMSLTNHLHDDSRIKISLEEFNLIVLDECHHTHDKNPYNELMKCYRILKYEKKSSQLPQILGLTASPGTNKAKDIPSAVDHLRKVMANLGVSKLSVVRKHKEDLLQFSTTPTKVMIRSATRQNDPVKDMIVQAMEYVEHKFNSAKVTSFLLNHYNEVKDLFEALRKPPVDKSELRYIQWIAESKDKVEQIINKDKEIPRLLHACLRHLELYADCLEINSLLEIDQVRDVITDGYGSLSYESQNANTQEEIDIITKLKEVFSAILLLGKGVEGNPDIKEIIKKIEDEFNKLSDESRFLIFVKSRATAKALAERLPDYLRCTHLTGSHISKCEGGLPTKQQLEVVDKFKQGTHLCIVATSVACEGLDIEQCNLVIRYRFRADEISSLQMGGRIRKTGGKEVFVGSQKEIEYEKGNIDRQYLMMQAIEKVSQLDLKRDIHVAEKRVFELEQTERELAKLQTSKKQIGPFCIICRRCGVEIADGSLLRHLKKKMYIVYSKEFIDKIDRIPNKNRKTRPIDGGLQLDKIKGSCGHIWGSMWKYDECEFPALSQKEIKFVDRLKNVTLDCKKWVDLPFHIPELSDEEIFRYNM